MSSPITLSGFNNIDFNAIKQILMQVERQPVDRLETQKATEQTRLTAYSSFNSRLTSFQSALEALESVTPYESQKASSSDTSILTASATSDASRGTFTIRVTSLARPQVTISTDDTSDPLNPTSGRFADYTSNVITGGSFSITPQGKGAVGIDMTGVQTLGQLRDAINAKQTETGVQASIINDGADDSKPFRLVLTSVNSGTANAFSVTETVAFSSPNTKLNLSTDPLSGVAKDSEFTYNGIPIKNSSSTVSNALPGLALTILKEGTASVTVSEDFTSLKDKIKAMVAAFNSFSDFFKEQTTTGSKVLAGDPLLRGVNRDLRQFITQAHANSGSYKYLAELGITLDRSGKMQVDDSALNDALTDRPNDVKAFLSGTSGFSAQLSNRIATYTRSGGSIDGVEDRINSAISSYDKRIEILEQQLILKEQSLTEQFAAADRAISQLNSQVSALSSLDSQYRLF
jgi:flagellar hook-associated protein 2